MPEAAPQVSFSKEELQAIAADLLNERPDDISEADWRDVTGFAARVIPDISMEGTTGIRRRAVQRLCLTIARQIQDQAKLSEVFDSWDSHLGQIVRREFATRLEMRLSLESHSQFDDYLSWVAQQKGKIKASLKDVPEHLHAIAGIVNKCAVDFDYTSSASDYSSVRKALGFKKIAEFLKAKIYERTGKNVEVEFKNLKFIKKRPYAQKTGEAETSHYESRHEWQDEMDELSVTRDAAVLVRQASLSGISVFLEKLVAAAAKLEEIKRKREEEKEKIAQKKAPLVAAVKQWEARRGAIEEAFEFQRQGALRVAQLTNPSLKDEEFPMPANIKKQLDEALRTHKQSAPLEVEELRMTADEETEVEAELNVLLGDLDRLNKEIAGEQSNLAHLVKALSKIDEAAFAVQKMEDLPQLVGKQLFLEIKDESGVRRIIDHHVEAKGLGQGQIIPVTVVKQRRQPFYTLRLKRNGKEEFIKIEDDRDLKSWSLIQSNPYDKQENPDAYRVGENEKKVREAGMGVFANGGDKDIYMMALCLAAEADTESPMALHIVEIAEYLGNPDQAKMLEVKVQILKKILNRIGFDITVSQISCSTKVHVTGKTRGLLLTPSMPHACPA